MQSILKMTGGLCAARFFCIILRELNIVHFTLFSQKSGQILNLHPIIKNEKPTKNPTKKVQRHKRKAPHFLKGVCRKSIKSDYSAIGVASERAVFISVVLVVV